MESSARSLLDEAYTELKVSFDAETGVLWTWVDQDDVPCVTYKLLEDLGRHHEAIEQCAGQVVVGQTAHPIRYSVLASLTPGVFNLGGQLALFRKLIDKRDREGLLRYATRCIDVIYPRIRRFDANISTITLIQGDALGGGLEAALASDVVIAERQSQMGFPEILFNLFPGMGAFSLVARKIGARQAEKMLLDGKIFSATELYDMGLVDVVAEEGAGVAAVHEFIRKQARRSNGFHAIQLAKQRFNPVTYQEMIDITNIWVDAALRLTEKDLKVMDRLVRSQEKLYLQPQAEVTRLHAA